ncbi:hypothetical protein [Herbaspirillum robiniae]|uniref:hypothetical protein n=1 Tax=Herbaspirillum robiniae TaxID=2014887 RepID=UPI0011E4CA54|nr:hypothetical protein [Herbaspirillum robiniae]
MSVGKYTVTLTAKQLEAVQMALQVRIEQCFQNSCRYAAYGDGQYWNERHESAESALEATRMTVVIA